MNKAVESVLVVVAAVGLYAGLPVLMIWGWVRWFRRTQPRTLPSILSLIGLALATRASMIYAGKRPSRAELELGGLLKSKVTRRPR